MKKFKVLQAHLIFMMLILSVFLSAGCGSGGGSGHWDSDDDTGKAILTFSLNGVAGTVNETGKTISVTLPFGTNVTALIATFTHTGEDVTVGAVSQTSGTTANNFTGPVLYTVTAEDGSTSIYTVTVALGTNSTKAIITYSFVGYPAYPGAVNEAAKTIAVTLPAGTNVTALVATFTHTGTVVRIGAVTQTSGTTANNFTTPKAYTVTAADSSTATYTVTVTVAAPLNSAKAITAYSFSGFAGYPGIINETAKTIAVTLPFGTNVTALCAIYATTGVSVRIGAVTQTSGTTVNNFTAPVTYRVTAADATFVDYVVTVTLALNPAKAITAYSFVGFAGYPGNINEAAKTIAVTLPFGTDVTTLIAAFTTTGVGVTIGAVAQTTGATMNDFTAPVLYTVTAADSSTATYTVTVTLAPNPAKAITAYSFVGFGGFPGTIDEAAKTIDVNLPPGTVVTALTANFTTTGVGVTIGLVTQTSGGAPANDFTAPVTYRVTAADATFVDYLVTVNTTMPNLGLAETFGTFGGGAGMTNEGNLTVMNGDIGTTSTANSSITGFHERAGNPLTDDNYTDTLGANSGRVTGSIYTCTNSTTGPNSAVNLAPATANAADCTLATQASLDAGAAFIELAGRPSDGVLAGNLAGTTIYPGVWTGGSVLISGGNVTLDALGDANAVFVFQIASTLDVGDAAIPRSVILAGNAQAKNIFWQVGTAATINPSGGGTIEGTIIANSGITFSTAGSVAIVTLNGRALSLISSVTMVNTIINVPAP